VASVVDTLAWVTRAALAVLWGAPSPLSAAADEFLADTTPEAIGNQMALRVEGHGQRVLPAPEAPGGGGGSTRAPYAGKPSAAEQPCYSGGYSYSALGASGVGSCPVRHGVLFSRGGAGYGRALDVGACPHWPGAGA